MEKNKSNNKLAKILIPVLIAVVVISIYGIKNVSDSTDSSSDTLAFEVAQINTEELSEAGKPVMVNFGSDSCVPCVQMRPELVKVYDEYNGQVEFNYLDVNVNPEGIDDVPITSIPTQLFLTADGESYMPSDSVLTSVSGWQEVTSTEDPSKTYIIHVGGLTEDEMKLILAEMGV